MSNTFNDWSPTEIDGFEVNPSHFEVGDHVLYLGHTAMIVHIFGRTSNIKFTEKIRGMSPQMDVITRALIRRTY